MTIYVLLNKTLGNHNDLNIGHRKLVDTDTIRGTRGRLLVITCGNAMVTVDTRRCLVVLVSIYCHLKTFKSD